MGWQWHQLDHMQIICTSLQTHNLTTQFLQTGCPSCRPTNSIKALKAVAGEKLRMRREQVIVGIGITHIFSGPDAVVIHVWESFAHACQLHNISTLC